MLFQWPWTLHSQCKMSLPNLETGRSQTLIYDTSRQLNLNANAFRTEPADYNLNCQADRLLTAISTIGWGAAGEMCRMKQRCDVVELNFSVFGGGGSLMTIKERIRLSEPRHAVTLQLPARRPWARHVPSWASQRHTTLHPLQGITGCWMILVNLPG